MNPGATAATPLLADAKRDNTTSQATSHILEINEAKESKKTISLISLPSEVLNNIMFFLGNYPADLPRDAKSIQAYCEAKRSHNFSGVYNMFGANLNNVVTYNIFDFNRVFYSLKGVAKCFSSAEEIQEVVLGPTPSEVDRECGLGDHDRGSYRFKWSKKITHLGYSPAVYCCASAQAIPTCTAQKIGCFAAATCFVPIGFANNIGGGCLGWFAGAAVDVCCIPIKVCSTTPECPAVTSLNLCFPSQGFFKPSRDDLLLRRLTARHLSHIKYNIKYSRLNPRPVASKKDMAVRPSLESAVPHTLSM